MNVPLVLGYRDGTLQKGRGTCIDSPSLFLPGTKGMENAILEEEGRKIKTKVQPPKVAQHLEDLDSVKCSSHKACNPFKVFLPHKRLYGDANVGINPETVGVHAVPQGR
jgi:hypothetical protein